MVTVFIVHTERHSEKKVTRLEIKLVYALQDIKLQPLVLNISMLSLFSPSHLLYQHSTDKVTDAQRI